MPDPTYATSQPSPWPVRWEVTSLAVIGGLSFIGILYFGLYVPTSGAYLNDAFLVAFFGTWATSFVALAYGLSAAAKLGPSMLITNNARFTTTEWHPTRLASTYGAIHRDALTAVGAPRDLIPDDGKVQNTGTNRDGQEVVLSWAMLGGGKILNFYSDPKKGAIVFPNPWITSLGQGSRHIHFSPYSAYALPQAAIPAEWIVEFETKSEGWFKRGDPVYILHGRDRNFDDFLRMNKPTIERILSGSPDPKYGGWDADALLSELLRAWTKINIQRREIDELENALEHRAGLLEGRARRALTIVRRSPSDEPPSTALANATHTDLRL